MKRIALLLVLAAWQPCEPRMPHPYCGDGIVNGDEQCDGGGLDTAACNATCTVARCGDGYFNPAADTSCGGNP